MASSSRQTIFSGEEALDMFLADVELDKDTWGMGEGEEYDLDR